jgi:non-specific serine/threonine protein kinase/serine/threonine-protein kinase
VNPERWARIKEVFTAATGLAMADRAAFLARETAGDAAILQELQSLLESHDSAGDFLEVSPAELSAAAVDAHGSAHAGDRLGAYRIVELIGTGGMGDVYKAVRDDDQYRAEVAIKVMRADVHSSLAEHRFRKERQILAALDHRNIARLIDGGTTAKGLPFVVMELVIGEPIDQFCNRLSLGTRERVQLFLQVCAAVSYAHQHLVVHRDLKPGNVLVTADGSVKLLDFGIAKLLEPDTVDGARTDNTRTMLRAMTLEYSSPEQVSGGVVTTVSDVYSLGVVLYRLLTGQSPYRAVGGEAARVAEILGETTPTRPSQLATRQRREIDGDIDNILLMALRKEPQKRYGSVEQLANDLRNYLGGRPVLARRGTFSYRFGKYVRRNKVPITAAVLVAASLIGGSALSIREARIAEAQRIVAQRHFASVRKLANKLFEFHDNVAKLPGATQVREDILKTSLEYLDALYKDSGGDNLLREELGTAYRKVGAIQNDDVGSSLGDSHAALRSFARAVALLEPVVVANPANDRAAVSLAKTYMQQTRVILLTSGAQAARPPGQKAIDIFEARKGGYSDDYERMTLLGNAYFTQAKVAMAAADSESAMRMIDRMVEVAEQYQRAHPQERRANSVLGDAYNNSGTATDTRMSRIDAARRSSALLRKSLAVGERLLAENPDDVAQEIGNAQTRYNLGSALYESGEFAAAADVHARAAPALARAAADTRDANATWAQAMNDIGLAAALTRLGRNSEAAPLFARAEASLSRGQKSGDENLVWPYALGTLDVRRGEMHAQLAGDPRIDALQRSDRWRKSHEYLTRGIAHLKHVNDVVTLTGSDKDVWDEGIAFLAQAEAALK